MTTNHDALETVMRLKSLLEAHENDENEAVRSFAQALLAEAALGCEPWDKKSISPLFEYMTQNSSTSVTEPFQPLGLEALTLAGQLWRQPIFESDYVRLIQVSVRTPESYGDSLATELQSQLLPEMLEGFFSVLAVMDEAWDSSLYLLVKDTPHFELQLQNCHIAMETDLMVNLQLLASPCCQGIVALPRLYQTLCSMKRLLEEYPHDDERGAITFESQLPDLLLDALPKDLMDNLRDTFRNYLSSDTEDEEIRRTAYQFLKCNLNITDTAKAMYLHRNTLVYRLEKIQRDTGFDLRDFNDSWTFKLLLSHLMRRR